MSCLELFFTITLQNCPFCPLSYLLSGNLPNLIISSTVARLTTNLLRYFLEKGHLITSKQKKHRLTLILLTNVNSFFTFSKLFSSFPAFSICFFFCLPPPYTLCYPSQLLQQVKFSIQLKTKKAAFHFFLLFFYNEQKDLNFCKDLLFY